MSTDTSAPSTQGRKETIFIETTGGLLTEQLVYKLRNEIRQRFEEMQSEITTLKEVTQ